MSTTTDTGRRVRLHIGEAETVMVTGDTDAQRVTLVMPLGTIKTGRQHFRHDPPTGLEIEHAIEAVEDELFRIQAAVAHGAVLCTADEFIKQIASVAGLDARETVLSRELVEQAFDRLAALAMGRPVAQDAMPTSPEFVCALVILRELMHHLQFPSITFTAEN